MELRLGSEMVKTSLVLAEMEEQCKISYCHVATHRSSKGKRPFSSPHQSCQLAASSLSLSSPSRRTTSAPSMNSLSCSLKPSFNPISNFTHRNSNPTGWIVPARDRVIDFGRHKGKMLGALPSNYLKWISSNLRARDFHDWAILADQVLLDPVYQDRVEWELAHNILTGNANTSSSAAGNPNAVSLLLEISERFGWDNDDKAAWSKIDFELLGTSKGGRIPRITDSGRQELRSARSKVEAALSEGSGKRKERRERMKMKRDNNSVGAPATTVTNSDGGFISPASSTKSFPGREALLKKLMTPFPDTPTSNLP